MQIRYFALVMGIVFLAVGGLGFVPGALAPADEPLLVETLHGRLLGLFPVNILHSFVHVLFGVWGVIAYGTVAASVAFAQVVAVSYAVLAVFGLIPAFRPCSVLFPSTAMTFGSTPSLPWPLGISGSWQNGLHWRASS